MLIALRSIYFSLASNTDLQKLYDNKLILIDFHLFLTSSVIIDLNVSKANYAVFVQYHHTCLNDLYFYNCLMK